MPPYLTTLGAAELRAEGIEGYAWGFADRVRFYELDALNHVNNTAFLRWFETARVSYMQDYGLSGYSHGPDDPQLVVRRQVADYFAPMFQNESYIVAARTRLVRPSSFIMDYAVHSGGTLRSAGEAVMVSLTQDGKTRRPHRPEAVRAMVERDGAEVQT
jgi:acyl-CoA thioester hydrolase